MSFKVPWRYTFVAYFLTLYFITYTLSRSISIAPQSVWFEQVNSRFLVPEC